jgi:peroxiredoxin
MSQAFVKENDDNELLSNVQPSMHALLRYLKRQNNGRDVYRSQFIIDKNGKEVHVMSNGLSYTLNDDNQWQMIF